jgi:hypothetical protein
MDANTKVLKSKLEVMNIAVLAFCKPLEKIENLVLSRFCGDNPVLVSNTTNIIPFTSDNNLAILQIYTLKNKFNLEVKYRYVDSTTDPTTFPVSCQPCQDKNTSCASLVESCNDPQIASDCPATCETCPT